MSWIWGSLIMDNPLLALRKGNLPEDAQSFQVGQVWEVSTDTKLVLGQSQNGQVVVLKTQYSHWWWEKHEKTRYLKAVLKDRNARTLSCFLLKSMILGPLFLVDFCCPIGFIAICLCEIGSTGIWSGPSQHLARLSTVKKQQIDLRWMGFFHRNQWFSRSTSRLTDFQKIFPDRFWVTKETQVPVARLGKSNEILTENVVTLDDMLTHAHSFLWNCMKSSFFGAWTALCWWFWFKHATSLLPGIVW